MMEDATPYMVERLVRGMETSLSMNAIEDVTTPADVVSACFTLLERLLFTLKSLEEPEEHEFNRVAIAAILNDLLMEFGMKVH